MGGAWCRENDFDRFLDSTRDEWPTDVPDVILLGTNDACMNYRLGLRQHGYLRPVYGHLFVEETAAWLYASLAAGERVLMPAYGPNTDVNELQTTFRELNRTRFMTERASSFSVDGSRSRVYFELTLPR